MSNMDCKLKELYSEREAGLKCLKIKLEKRIIMYSKYCRSCKGFHLETKKGKESGEWTETRLKKRA